MPCQARIDAPGALYHVIVRGIVRRRVFNDDADRDFFVERLGRVLSETQSQCFASSPNTQSFSFAVENRSHPDRMGDETSSDGYAMHYNRRHRRNGHLFQQLDRYRYSGHSALMGHRPNEWQAINSLGFYPPRDEHLAQW